MYNQYQQPFNNVIRVAGVDAVRNFQMPPNSVGAFFCETQDVFYFKTTDGTGFPTTRAYSFKEIPLTIQAPVSYAERPLSDYVTHDELEKLTEKLDRLMEALGDEQ